MTIDVLVILTSILDTSSYLVHNSFANTIPNQSTVYACTRVL